MNKHYAAFILFFSYFLFVTFLPKNVDSASKQTANKISNISENTETAILAGGCFWCMEHPYEDLPGISQVISGYTGGKKNNSTYKEVASGSTLHVEAVEIHFDPEKISYNDILEIFWRNIDPTDAGGQFVDRGKQYTTGIYYKNEQQKIRIKKKNCREQTIQQKDCHRNSSGRTVLSRRRISSGFFQEKLYPLQNISCGIRKR